MPYRTALPRIALPVLFVCLCLVPSAVIAGSAPAFWVATKGTAKVYLFGSMHFGRQDFYPLPDVVEQALINSPQLVVEVNLLNLGMDAQQIIFRHAGLPDNLSLTDVISSKTYSTLTEQANGNNVPVAAFSRFQPWYVTLTLVEAEIRKTDLRQQLGLDLYFLKRAAAIKKPVRELETLDSQLALFSSIAFADQEKFLSQTLADIQKSRDYLKAAADAWMSGDVHMLSKTLIEPFQTHQETTQLFDTMFTQRNIKMTTTITDYLESGESAFVVVGVGHMLGEQGIVQLLTARGFGVRRISTSSRVDDSPVEPALPASPATGLP